MPKVSVIIPIYNEVNSLRQIVEKILNIDHGVSYEIIMVDSGSNDGSTELVKKLDTEYKLISLHLPKNLGKGYCIRQALKIAKGEIILIQDADLEYDPIDYVELLNPLLSHQCKFVLGSRHLYAKTWRIRTLQRPSWSMEIINYGSEFLTKIFCLLFNVKISDTQTMYKVFYKDLLNDIQLKCNGFDLDWEILSKLVLKGHIPIEIPVRYAARTAAEGKKLKFFKDGFAALFTILKIRFFNY